MPDQSAIHFDPRELKVLNAQDRDSVRARFDERLIVAMFHPGPTPELEEATIQYLAPRHHLRVVRIQKIGDSDTWMVLDNNTIILKDEGKGDIHGDALTILTGGSDSPPFHMVPFQPMSSEEFSTQYGHKFRPAC